EQQHRNLAELIPFGGWTADGSGNMISLSDSFLNAFHVSIDECAGLRWAELIAEDQRVQVLADWGRCVESGYFWDYEYRMRSKAGKRYTVLSRGVPVRGEGRRSWVGIHLDITERERSAEQRLKQAQELSRFNAELEQLAYVSSHDLQEPLRMIASYLQLIERRYTGSLDEDGRSFIGYAVEGANRLRNLLQDLMLLQQVEKVAAAEAVAVKDRWRGNGETRYPDQGGECHDRDWPFAGF
ncbi:MAG: PAS domain S-box protein, partial [Bryobacteraceae bacterium]